MGRRNTADRKEKTPFGDVHPCFISCDAIMWTCCCRELLLFDRGYYRKVLLAKQEIYSRYFIAAVTLRDWLHWTRLLIKLLYLDTYFIVYEHRCKLFHKIDYYHLRSWSHTVCMDTNCFHHVLGHNCIACQWNCYSSATTCSTMVFMLAWLLEAISHVIVLRWCHHMEQWLLSTSFNGATVWTTPSSTFIYAYNNYFHQQLHHLLHHIWSRMSVQLQA